MTRRLVFLLLASVAALVAVVRWQPTPPAEPSSVAVRNGYRLAIATAKARRGLAAPMRDTDDSTTAVLANSATLDTAQAGLADALADAAAALADSAATIETLRRELGRLAHHAAEVDAAADKMQRRIDGLIAAQAVERAAFLHFAALADSTIQAQQKAIALLQAKPPLVRRVLVASCRAATVGLAAGLGAMVSPPVAVAAGVGGYAVGAGACR